MWQSREYRFTCVCSLRTNWAPQSLAWCHVSQILRKDFRIVRVRCEVRLAPVCPDEWAFWAGAAQPTGKLLRPNCLCKEFLDFTKTVNWLPKILATILLFVLLITEKQASPFLNKKFLFLAFLALSLSYILLLSVTFSFLPWNVTHLARKPLSICRLDANLCPYSVTVTKYLWMDSLWWQEVSLSVFCDCNKVSMDG